MTKVKTIASGLLIGLGLAVISSSAVAAGTIILREADPTKICSIAATEGDHVIDDEGCDNDQYYDFRLEQVDSALYIEFWDDGRDGECKQGGNNTSWTIGVTTIKQRTTTEFESLAGTARRTIGSVITPGLVMTWYENPKNKPIHGHLSCIRVGRK